MGDKCECVCVCVPKGLQRICFEQQAVVEASTGYRYERVGHQGNVKVFFSVVAGSQRAFHEVLSLEG